MIYYVDGFTNGKNPSDTGGGFTIYQSDTHIRTEHISKEGFTCNEAELLGMLACAKIASQNDFIYTDSMNTLAWVKRGGAKARPDLNPQCAEAKSLVGFKNLQLLYVPRNENKAGIYNEFTLKK